MEKLRPKGEGTCLRSLNQESPGLGSGHLPTRPTFPQALWLWVLKARGCTPEQSRPALHGLGGPGLSAEALTQRRPDHRTFLRIQVPSAEVGFGPTAGLASASPQIPAMQN